MSLLKEPIVLNHVKLSNRLVMPPMATAKCEDGTITPDILEYYDEKSRGGYIGLIISEHHYINLQGKANKGQVSISRDSDIAGLKKLVDTIHNNNTPVICQISHAGSSAKPELTGMPTVSASRVLNNGSTGKNNILPEEMTQAQIDEVIRNFAEAAGRAKQAGYDGVEIHSAHAYLLNQFYSPLTNKRVDAYNGSTIEGRLKLHMQIIQAVREITGPDYLVALRLGGCDYMEGGSTLEDSVAAAKLLEKSGIDLLDISGGFIGYKISGNREQGYFADMTELIKKEVSLPVLLTGGFQDANTAEKFLAENKADLIGVGRAILRDSNWAKNNMQ